MTRQMRSMTRLIWIATLLLLTVIAPATAAPSATAEGERGMVVSAQHEASEAGRRILEAGGNAIDAAVAVGYALAVVDPCCGNIGGGGFMLIHTADGHDTVIDFRSAAPPSWRRRSRWRATVLRSARRTRRSSQPAPNGSARTRRRRASFCARTAALTPPATASCNPISRKHWR